MRGIVLKAASAALVACWSVDGMAAITPTYEDGGKTMVLDVATDDTLDIAIPSTVTNLVKTGVGKATLTMAAAWAAGAGEVKVQAGTLVIGAYANMGTPSKVTVTDGATLDFTGLPATLCNSSYLTTQFYVSGNGCNGAGALRYTSVGVKNHGLLKCLTLTGDTKFVGPTYTNANGQIAISQDHGWGVGQYGGQTSTTIPKLDMGGYTLTVEGSMCLGNSGYANNVTLSNPGDIVLLDKARLILPSMMYLTVDGTGAATFPAVNGKTITMGKDTKILVYMLRHAPTWNWKVVVPKDNYASYYHLSNGEYEKRGNIYMPFEVEGTLAVRHFSDCSYPLHFLAPVTGGGQIVHYTEANANYAAVETRVESTNKFSIGSLAVQRGPMAFVDAGTVSVTNFYKNSGTLYGTAETVIGGSSDCNNYIARLNLRGNTHFGGGDGAGHCSDHAIMVGKDKYGILDISGGATVSNMIYMARQNGDYGAVWLSGATSEIYWPSTANNRSLIGDVGYGCMMMSGGKVTMTGKTMLLGRNAGSGYWFQSGGTTVVKDDTFWLARPSGGSQSTADLHVQGGTFDAQKGIWFMNPDDGHNWSGPRVVMTVGGGTTPATLSTTTIQVLCTTNKAGAVALINVNSNGTLVADKLYRDRSPGLKAIAWTAGDWSPTHLRLNFNGGTLKFRSTLAEFFVDATRVPTSTLVYAGGATFDTDGHNVGFAAALAKPTGKGITSVTIPDAYAGTKEWFIGTSRVLGYGAAENVSGLTVFDTSTRSVTGVILTCPGNDVQDGDKISMLDRTRNGRECTVTRETLATTGGVTKKGAGTLTLKGANTYGGATRVEAGTLAFTHANGYPGGDLEIPAAALTTNGVPFVTAVNFALETGKKIRITDVDAATFEPHSFGRRRTLVTSTNAMSASLLDTLELTDGAGQAVAAANLWRLMLTQDGKTLAFSANTGTCLILR